MEKNLEIREGRQEQWKPTCTPWIFFFFHKNFPMNIQKDSLLFFLCPVSISIIVNAKKSKLDREDKSNGNPLVHHAIFIFLHKNFPLNMKNDSLLFFFYTPVRISIIMNAHT